MCRTMAILAMVCALASQARAENSPEADAKATPLGVHQVLTGGFWSDGKVDGRYRIVIIAGGFEHVSHRMFIQWIAIDPDEQEYKLVRTVAVTEVSDLSGVTSDLKPSFNPNGPLRFTFTLHGRDGKIRKRSVTATTDGKYSIR